MEKTPEQLDCVTAYLVKNKIPLTQENWIRFATFGDKSIIGELEGEEVADLPEGFEFWPATELHVN